MIVYIFYNGNFRKITLPTNFSGMYALRFDDIVFGNIIGNNNGWNIKLNDDYNSNDLKDGEGILNVYQYLQVNSVYGHDAFSIVAIPKFDNNTVVLEVFAPFTVGNNPSCNIYYPYDIKFPNGKDILTISKNQDGSYNLSTDSENFYNQNENLKNVKKALNGDYVFLYGLKVMLLGHLIMVNHPSDNMKIMTGSINYRDISKKNDIQKYRSANVEELPLFTKDDYFYKSPRLNFIIKPEKVQLDVPPEKEKEDETPLILIVGPQLTMVGTSVLSLVNYLFTFLTGDGSFLRLAISIGTIGITVVGTLLWPNITRTITHKRMLKREKLRQNKYTEYLNHKKSEIDMVKANQKATLIENYPSAEKCISIIDNKDRKLWQRNIDHEDFLDIRLGIGKINTKIDIDIPKEQFSLDDEDNLLAKAKEVANESLVITDVPISYNFTNNSINAIVGEEKLTKEFLDCLFLEMLTFQSYTDLKLVVFSKTPEKYNYLRIAPHCWNNQKTLRYFATSLEEFSMLASGLEKTFDARVSENEEEQVEDNGEKKSEERKFENYRPYYLFFTDDIAVARNVALVNKILHYRKNVGFSILITSSSISLLPSETSDFICISESDSAVMTSEINENQKIFKADLNVNDQYNIYAQIQKLANIPVLVEKEKYELPTSLSFLEMYNLGRVEQLNSLERWSKNNPVLSLAVPVGIDQHGEIFKMDIHEKAYGPHGLVAGTTGSGKSEWIVTYILSLAVNFSPEEVQFVLIDYKGGGLALSFENAELGIKLPHLAGTITNLDKSEIFRSIAAIESELKRRQAVFNEVREKLKEGSMNIYKYQQLYRKGLVAEPMSHLLIICDEFAELKSQQPEFMDQLISTSRIGRSLGIHLILATQKPSGVVNDQIWSNSKFKVCLKVQSKSDSNEMLKKPDAAFLKQTGAFYLQVGNDDYYNLGQSAWAGAKYYPTDVIKKKIDDSIVYIDNVGRVIEKFDVESNKKEVVAQGEELINIVKYISEISKNIEIKSKQLWLESLKTTIYLSDLYKKYNKEKSKQYSYVVGIGEYDEPRCQEQGLLSLNLENGNIAIVSQNSASADNIISTILWATIIEHTPYEIAHYIIDFGSETLKKFAKFPHVGEVIVQGDNDSVAGILNLIADEMEKRKQLFSDYNGSFTYYNKVANEKIPLIVLTINSYDIFLESFPKLSDLFINLFRDAPKLGIIFIASASSQSAFRQKQLQFVNNYIVMQLKDDSMYRSLTNCRRGLIPKNVLGRGICKINDMDNDSYNEFQTALIAPPEQELDIIRKYADYCCNYYIYKVKQLTKIPENVTSSDLIKHIDGLEGIPIGYNVVTKDVTKYNLGKQKMNIITGRNIKEYVNFFNGLINVLSKVPNIKIRVVDFSNIIKLSSLDIKLFNKNLAPVIAALEKDAINRTDNDNMAINIIVGIGSYKRKLSSAGVEIFESLFSKISDAKQAVYILIDNYDEIRNLKSESWFDGLTDIGLWLGDGIGTQSLFNSVTVSSEDKKYEFKGLGYFINDGEYDVVKVMMDGDK